MGDMSSPGLTPARDLPETAPPHSLGDSAPRRTWLAAERTYLAWVRTALGALGMALAVGRLLPALTDVSHVAFGLLGAAYGLFGLVLLLLAAYRSVGIRASLAAEQQLPEHAWTLWLVTGFALVLGACTVVLVLVEI
jgi:putative membrane protein